MSRTKPSIKFCAYCGGPIEFRVPSGDNLARAVCLHCDAVHYQNPKVVAGCIVEFEDRILLCKRAIEPRSGLWTIPAGFMELGETTQAAAKRETMEEACADAIIDDLFAVYNIPSVSQVYVIFRAHLVSAEFSPGVESLQTALFAEDEIPWNELAFRVVQSSLERYFAKAGQGQLAPFYDDIL